MKEISKVKVLNELKEIQGYLETNGINFSPYNPCQRADLILCFNLGRIYSVDKVKEFIDKKRPKRKNEK